MKNLSTLSSFKKFFLNKACTDGHRSVRLLYAARRLWVMEFIPGKQKTHFKFYFEDFIHVHVTF